MAKQIAVIYAVSVIIVCRYSLHYTNSHLEVGISLHLLAQMFLLLLLLLLSAFFFYFRIIHFLLSSFEV